jgi:hypothetical protein
VRVRPGAVVLGAVGIAVGTGAVLAMREATLSTHQPVGRDSEVVIELEADVNDPEGGRSTDDMVEALLTACRLEVDHSEVVDLANDGDGRYTAVLRPGLDQTNQRQLRGCLEDFSIDHLRVDVLAITGH